MHFTLIYFVRALETICLWRAGADRRKPHPTINRNEASSYAQQHKISLLHAERQGDANHETAKSDIYRHRYLCYRFGGCTYHEKGPLRDPHQKRKNGGCCFHGLRNQVRATAGSNPRHLLLSMALKRPITTISSFYSFLSRLIAVFFIFNQPAGAGFFVSETWQK